MNFLFHINTIFIISCLATNPLYYNDTRSMNKDISASYQREKHCEQASNKEQKNIFLLLVFEDIRELYKNEILKEQKESCFTEFLKGLFPELLLNFKGNYHTDIQRKNSEVKAKKVFDELIAEYENKYGKEQKQEYINKDEVKILIEDITSDEWFISESKFCESNENDRDIFFNTLISINLLEKLKYVKAKIEKIYKTTYIKWIILQTMLQLDGGIQTDKTIIQLNNKLNDLDSTIKGYVNEVKNMNSNDKRIALTKYKKLQNDMSTSQWEKMINNKEFEERFLKNVIPIIKRIFQETKFYIAETEKMKIVDTIKIRSCYKSIVKEKSSLELLNNIFYNIDEFERSLNVSNIRSFYLEHF